MNFASKEAVGLFITVYLVISLGCSEAIRTGQNPAQESPRLISDEDCPLNVSELNYYQWMIRPCHFQSDTSQCCEAMTDLVKILLFSWIHNTGSFLLPSNHTAAACISAIEQHLRTQGVPDHVFLRCKLRPQDLVSTQKSCHTMQNIADFEAAVDASNLKRYCKGSGNGSPFNCESCIQSMVVALNHLVGMNGAAGKQFMYCELFVMMYVGGGINSFPDLGFDAVYCLVGVMKVLPALAPTSALWPEIHELLYQSKRRSGEVKIIHAIAIPAVVMVALMFMIHACITWRRVYRLGVKKFNIWRTQQMLRESVDKHSGLLFFDLEEIKEATKNFSALNVIGEGGFSTIYRGVLEDGSQIAVKRFKDLSNKGDADFQHEVQVISSVRHRNLLPLRGYCIATNEGIPEQFLVYDFMANGSLADYIFQNSHKRCLTWEERQKIAVGIARGLTYLHEDAKPTIIHRDVKTANVLLDADLNPLVADFGLAKFKPDDGSNHRTHCTTRAVGTVGYMAPEYALCGHLTDKSDVFSFGIVLLELMSGKRALGPDHVLISDWACDLVKRGMLEEVIDPGIRLFGPREGMERIVLLALQCAHPRVACRPSISQAQAILEGLDRPLPEIVNMDEMQWSTDEYQRGTELKWLLAPDIEGRISYTSVALGNISTDSYYEGR